MNTKEYLEYIVKKYGLHFKDRQRELVYQRFAFCYYTKSLGYPLTTIAKFVNYKDHTSVLHALEQAQNLLDTKDILYAECTYHLQMELGLCPKPIKTREKENVIVTILKRINELPYSPESEALKAFVNENINPEKLKK